MNSIQIEIIDSNKIKFYKRFFKKHATYYSEDFLIDNIIFVKISNNLELQILKNKDLKINQSKIAYLMN